MISNGDFRSSSPSSQLFVCALEKERTTSPSYYTPHPPLITIYHKTNYSQGSLARAGILNRYHRFYKRGSLGSLDDSFGDDTEGEDSDSGQTSEEGAASDGASAGAGDDNDEDYDPENPAVLRSPHKRHIASIVRSGWMPSFRPSRNAGRFSRSGRARSQIVGS